MKIKFNLIFAFGNFQFVYARNSRLGARASGWWVSASPGRWEARSQRHSDQAKPWPTTQPTHLVSACPLCSLAVSTCLSDWSRLRLPVPRCVCICVCVCYCVGVSVCLRFVVRHHSAWSSWHHLNVAFMCVTPSIKRKFALMFNADVNKYAMRLAARQASGRTGGQTGILSASRV